MSKTRDVETLILTYFADDKEHTVAEFKEVAVKKELIPQRDYSAVYNALYRLKGNPRVQVVSKGIYRITPASRLEEALNFLENSIEHFSKLDIVNFSEEEYTKCLQEMMTIRRSLTICLRELELVILENKR